ncbi:ABC transporter permease [Temperatibacter marinus]|uniref:ABC transporter permease n=1 Tax=Temperatibacter marinus TaxID=1456591 RepID=A0AA52ELE5_9PROT|nr:ABC transporter permease [Temperatibacter marinus]WND04166.1 ABC transporter permease [Temperatibacter marinus]
MVFKLAWATIKHKPLSNLLTVFTLAIAVALISILLQFSGHMDQRLQKDFARIDMVVGAKGSPMQIVLSSVMHVDIPTGNIPLSEVKMIRSHRFVESAVPIALGDSYAGYRLVGSSLDFFKLYDVDYAAGSHWNKSHQVVIGAETARVLDLQLGSKFESAHGVTDGGASHDHVDYEVVGILKPTGSIVDRLLLTSIESIWLAHGQNTHASSDHEESQTQGHNDDRDQHHHDENHSAEFDIWSVEAKDKEVTALLLQYRSPVAAITLPQVINKRPGLQAAIPSFEIARLYNLLSGFFQVAELIGLILILIGGLSIFTTLSQTSSQKMYDIALLRARGMKASWVFIQLLLEGIILAFFSVFIGIGLGHLATFAAFYSFEAFQNVNMDGTTFYLSEVQLIVVTFAIAIVAVLWPAVKGFRVDPQILLKNGK